MQLYHGDLLPKDSWDILVREKNAYIVDVRTKAEWHYVGGPDPKDFQNEIIKIEWLTYPDMQLNPDFASELMQCVTDKSAILIFICHTGMRSGAAADKMISLGYANCFNILNGFNGVLDPQNHRGTINGWKADKLPWRQD